MGNVVLKLCPSSLSSSTSLRYLRYISVAGVIGFLESFGFEPWPPYPKIVIDIVDSSAIVGPGIHSSYP